MTFVAALMLASAGAIQGAENRAAFRAEGQIGVAPLLDPDAPGLVVTGRF